uniref:Uncharacterized protein n=1 Tax=Anguilla anguilla TaxID=7936 RepID=A0A0E9WHI4_ANGAN
MNNYYIEGETRQGGEPGVLMEIHSVVHKAIASLKPGIHQGVQYSRGTVCLMCACCPPWSALAEVVWTLSVSISVQYSFCLRDVWVHLNPCFPVIMWRVHLHLNCL